MEHFTDPSYKRLDMEHFDVGDYSFSSLRYSIDLDHSERVTLPNTIALKSRC